MKKKKKKNPVPLSHSNMTDEEKRAATKDPNVFIPSIKKNG